VLQIRGVKDEVESLEWWLDDNIFANLRPWTKTLITCININLPGPEDLKTVGAQVVIPRNGWKRLLFLNKPSPYLRIYNLERINKKGVFIVKKNSMKSIWVTSGAKGFEGCTLDLYWSDESYVMFDTVGTTWNKISLVIGSGSSCVFPGPQESEFVSEACEILNENSECFNVEGSCVDNIDDSAINRVENKVQCHSPSYNLADSIESFSEIKPDINFLIQLKLLKDQQSVDNLKELYPQANTYTHGLFLLFSQSLYCLLRSSDKKIKLDKLNVLANLAIAEIDEDIANCQLRAKSAWDWEKEKKKNGITFC